MSSSIPQSAIIYRDQLTVQVRTGDFGAQNEAVALVKDKNGRAMELRTEWVRKAGEDDVFEASVPLSYLDRHGLDTTDLSVFSGIGSPGAANIDGSRALKPRLLEPNATADLGPSVQRSEQQKTVELYGGTLAAGLVHQAGPMTGSHTASRQVAVTGLELREKNGFFGGAPELQIELVPERRITRMQLAGSRAVEVTLDGQLDHGARALVTLTRGEDGVYRASAGANKAFFSALSETGYGASALTDIRVSVRSLPFANERNEMVGPHEDSQYGKGYGLLTGS
jgi:hypothetical protein